MVIKKYKESPREFYSENEILNMNHVLKQNAEPKSIRLTKNGHVYLYDFLDSVSLNQKKQKEKKTTCAECGFRSSEEFFIIATKSYCSKCNEVFKRNKNTYIEKFLFNKKVSFFLEKTYLNKKIVNYLDSNDANSKALEGNLEFRFSKDNFKKTSDILVYLNGELLGLFPKQIIIERYKSLPSFSFSTDKIGKLLEKGVLKLDGRVSLLKSKTNFQGKKSHKIAITINSL